jgi:hypothetical protein
MAAPAHASPVEDYAAYQPQRTCATTVKPGTEFLLGWLVRRYPGTSASSLLRACTPGTSEHKDGRALDWGVDVTEPARRAQADAFFERVFRPNAAGEQHALARRMGIMYVIWNDHSYGSYNRFDDRDYLSSSCRTLRTCSATLRHRDHVHISLSPEGARAETSFYVKRGVGR